MSHFKFDTDDLVYVNSRHGVVTGKKLKDADPHYDVEFENGSVIEYPEDKLIRRYPHCRVCNRRISSGDMCQFCKESRE